MPHLAYRVYILLLCSYLGYYSDGGGTYYVVNIQ